MQHALDDEGHARATGDALLELSSVLGVGELVVCSQQLEPFQRLCLDHLFQSEKRARILLEPFYQRSTGELETRWERVRSALKA